MSSFTKYNTLLNRQKRVARKEKNEKLNANSKNHVSEDVKSKNGFPFHFAGPKKQKSS